MPINSQQRQLVQQLPAIEKIVAQLTENTEKIEFPRDLLVRCARDTVDQMRQRILAGDPDIGAREIGLPAVARQVRLQVEAMLQPNLSPVINATGIVVHTNLGRSLLADEAIDHIQALARHYSNLEFDLALGRRGSRNDAIESLLVELTGAESALVVNNNAAAVMLCLNSLAFGREVVVSRGELVEIGGSFRVPDIMTKSGARLREVGTTNRTHPKDYTEAIGSETAMLLKVHASNYHIVGFTAAVPLAELVRLGRQTRLMVMEDLGSGTLLDFSEYGLIKEPTVQQSVAAGADVVTFSGDKLLGGPQAGIIVGRQEALEQIRRNPMARALRIDKLTLAALEATLRLYRDPKTALAAIPTLRMLTMTVEQTRARAQRLIAKLRVIADSRLHVEMTDSVSRAGGGALPQMVLDTCCVALQMDGVSVNWLERRLRTGKPTVIGRIEQDRLLLDMRTIDEDELSQIVIALQKALERIES